LVDVKFILAEICDKGIEGGFIVLDTFAGGRFRPFPAEPDEVYTLDSRPFFLKEIEDVVNGVVVELYLKFGAGFLILSYEVIRLSEDFSVLDFI